MSKEKIGFMSKVWRAIKKGTLAIYNFLKRVCKATYKAVKYVVVGIWKGISISVRFIARTFLKIVRFIVNFVKRHIIISALFMIASTVGLYFVHMYAMVAASIVYGLLLLGLLITSKEHGAEKKLKEAGERINKIKEDIMEKANSVVEEMKPKKGAKNAS